MPAIANWFCQFYANHLGLGPVSLSATANERLSNYLWFGNLNEMETVIARTLALQRTAGQAQWRGYEPRLFGCGKGHFKNGVPDCLN
jgi:transcriptional regulator with GAF, ATPase, and Fis domain